MLRGLICANGNAVAGDLAEFLEESIGLRHVILRDRANASVEVAFECGKTDRKALSSHFDIAFAQSPESAERFVGIGGKHHCGVFVAREEAVGNAHCFVGLLRAFDVHAAFRVGDGENDDVAAVGEIEMDLGMIFESGLAEFVGFGFDIGEAEGFFHNLVEKQACAEQCRLGFNALGRFNACFSFGSNSVYIGFDRFFRFQKSDIKIICFCVCHDKPP